MNFRLRFALVFGPLFLGMPFDVKRRAGLAKTVFGPGFECFGKFKPQIAFHSIPALLKCDLGPFVWNAILHVHLTVLLPLFGPAINCTQ